MYRYRSCFEYLRQVMTRVHPVLYIPSMTMQVLSMGEFLQSELHVKGNSQCITLIHKNKPFMLCSKGTFNLTWVGWLWLHCFACCSWSLLSCPCGDMRYVTCIGVMATLKDVSHFVYFLPFLFTLYSNPECSQTIYNSPHYSRWHMI